MTMQEIAFRLNELAISGKYRIGHLQDIRKEITGKECRGKIFDKRTIFDKDEYAYHVGGREELQFNIGYENDIRHGLR